MVQATKLVLYHALILVQCEGLQLPNPFALGRDARFFGMTSPASALAKPRLNEKKQALLEAVSFTNNGKTATPEQQQKVLQLVHELEADFLPSSKLLTQQKEAETLNGVWYLQYTSSGELGGEDRFPDAWKPSNAKEGDANIETNKFYAKGSVSAAGIPVETANRRVLQIIDVVESRVTNDVDLEWGRLIASGRFRPSPSVPNRALVSFDTFKIRTNIGLGVDLGFLFPLLAKLHGSKENGWLETTFVDQDMRIGRGNKGTLFVLTRDPDAVQP